MACSQPFIDSDGDRPNPKASCDDGLEIELCQMISTSVLLLNDLKILFYGYMIKDFSRGNISAVITLINSEINELFANFISVLTYQRHFRFKVI